MCCGGLRLSIGVGQRDGCVRNDTTRVIGDRPRDRSSAGNRCIGPVAGVLGGGLVRVGRLRRGSHRCNGEQASENHTYNTRVHESSNSRKKRWGPHGPDYCGPPAPPHIGDAEIPRATRILAGSAGRRREQGFNARNMLVAVRCALSRPYRREDDHRIAGFQFANRDLGKALNDLGQFANSRIASRPQDGAHRRRLWLILPDSRPCPVVYLAHHPSTVTPWPFLAASPPGCAALEFAAAGFPEPGPAPGGPPEAPLAPCAAL